MKISSNKGTQAPLKNTESDYSLEQSSETSDALDGTLRQYLKFNTDSGR